MLVVLSNDLPLAVRGRMKLWFIEPRPNVFISGVKDSVADDVVKYLYKHCSVDSGNIIFQRIKQPPGYKVRGIGTPRRELISISGFQLIQEKQK
ncbi:type I-E CRISPR-associated endoribonuclease Cas2 [candidate division WOR-3 bacterium]|nr:type I-E CRISPR-associated endoribonuclease Cas2 [candidate division WOR-3 bacterium]